MSNFEICICVDSLIERRRALVSEKAGTTRDRFVCLFVCLFLFVLSFCFSHFFFSLLEGTENVLGETEHLNLLIQVCSCLSDCFC